MTTPPADPLQDARMSRDGFYSMPRLRGEMKTDNELMEAADEIERLSREDKPNIRRAKILSALYWVNGGVRPKSVPIVPISAYDALVSALKNILANSDYDPNDASARDRVLDQIEEAIENVLPRWPQFEPTERKESQ
jgi:hypothetical protein